MVNFKLGFIAAVFFLSSPALAVDAVQGCYDRAKTQLEINRCSDSAFQAADRELNQVYRSVLKKHEDNARFLDKLKAAQRLWLKWRDAEMEAVYPEKDDPSAYGSSFPACWNNQLAMLTRDRTKQLRKWLEGTEEGDVCSGSFPVKK